MSHMSLLKFNSTSDARHPKNDAILACGPHFFIIKKVSNNRVQVTSFFCEIAAISLLPKQLLASSFTSNEVKLAFSKRLYDHPQKRGLFCTLWLLSILVSRKCLSKVLQNLTKEKNEKTTKAMALL